MMYRRSAKTKFTKMYKNKALLYFVFNITEPYEVKWKKDVCEFTNANIINMYKRIAHDYLSLLRFHIVLEEYATFVKGSDNSYSKIDLRQIYNKNNIYTECDICFFVNSLINPVDKILIQAPFYGVYDYDELESISKSSIDVKNNVLHLPNREIVVPEDLLTNMIDCIDTYEYVNGNDSYPLIGDGIIKFKETLNLYSQSVRYYVNNRYTRKYKREIDSGLSYYRVCKSGIINAAANVKSKYCISSIKDLLKHSGFEIMVTKQYSPINVEPIIIENKEYLFG